MGGVSDVQRVSGVDPSLTSTGIAVVTRTEGVPPVAGRTFLTTSVVKSDTPELEGDVHPAVYEVHRVESIVEQVCRSVAGSELVYVESPAFASKSGKPAERAHLYFAMLAAFVVRRIRFDTLTPAQLKKRVTGNGRAQKDEVLDAVRAAWGERGWVDTPVGGRSDRADAAGLAWVAAHDLGWDVCTPGNRVPTPRAA